MPIEIKEIHSSDSVAYKQFLLQGLEQDYENFRISPTDEKESPFPTRDKPDSFTLGAFEGNQWAGIVSFQREGENREKLRHKGLLFRMYISPAFRGKGIGQALIAELLNRVRALEDIEQINLTVVADNAVAKKVYEKFGFRSFAREVHAMKWKGKYYTEEQMVLFLRQPS
ncbi:GNAT family N-acetyltransferase [Rhodocytophaga rosea]|uniref:GNAT family N-acetyltransferase n=1 Tax=Rhodocytophaga rosea TaxID=2704465 RepID=A0A6C0GDK7_9BACT|nr:GNAT family N-acetyltransferase [Rhodocytophaga rosea]QHT66055.1 GNAT family N-acetyltransferase [Rhodocytophaga rosea]